MLRRWVFKISKGGFNTYADSLLTKEALADEEIKIEAYGLNEAWLKVAALLPVNTRNIEMTRIEYL